MKKLATLLTLLLMSANLFGLFEFGAGFGIADNLMTEIKDHTEEGYEKFDAFYYALDLDLRGGIQLIESNPLYLIFDLRTGFIRRSHDVETQFGHKYSDSSTDWKMDIAPGLMFKFNEKIRASVTFGWYGEHRWEDTSRAWTLNLSGDMDFSTENLIILTGMNYRKFSAIGTDDGWTDCAIYHNFDLSLKVGRALYTELPFYLYGVFNQMWTSRSYKEIEYPQWGVHKFECSSTYYGPEVMIQPIPSTKLTASFGLTKGSVIFSNDFNDYYDKDSRPGSIVEISAEYNNPNQGNGLFGLYSFYGLKFTSASGWVSKPETMYYQGIFLYARLENRQRRNNNRIPSLSTGRQYGLFDLKQYGIPAYGKTDSSNETQQITTSNSSSSSAQSARVYTPPTNLSITQINPSAANLIAIALDHPSASISTGSKIAVICITASEKNLTERVIDEIEKYQYKKRHQIIKQTDVEGARTKMNIHSYDVDEKTAINLGKKLRANYVIMGRAQVYRNGNRINLSVINVGTGDTVLSITIVQ